MSMQVSNFPHSCIYTLKVKYHRLTHLVKEQVNNMHLQKINFVVRPPGTDIDELLPRSPYPVLEGTIL